MSETLQQPRGMPLWGKIALGCLAVVVIGTATCAGAAYLIYKKGSELIGGMAKGEWNDMRAAVDRIMKDDEARAFYADHAGLKERFPTEEEFLAAVRRWRPRLEPLPEEIPVFRGNFSLNKRLVDGRSFTEVSYLNGKGARVRFTWERGALVDIDVAP